MNLKTFKILMLAFTFATMQAALATGEGEDQEQPGAPGGPSMAKADVKGEAVEFPPIATVAAEIKASNNKSTTVTYNGNVFSIDLPTSRGRTNSHPFVDVAQISVEDNGTLSTKGVTYYIGYYVMASVSLHKPDGAACAWSAKPDKIEKGMGFNYVLFKDADLTTYKLICNK